jgi:voltage-gated potassium channel
VTAERSRHRLHRIIFRTDTPAGRRFDLLLIVSIVASVVVVMLDSVAGIVADHGRLLWILEWVFTFFFSVEYLLRLYCSPNPHRYAVSFFGVIDLVSVLPTYLMLFFPAGKFFLIIRLIRILRIFRVLKLVQYIGEADALARALWASRRKITVFLFCVLTLVCVFGAAMYVIEGEQNGFTSIPRSIYWAVVTLTTVGYGDISPRTGPGQFLAAIIMVFGYAIIVVPTGIVSAEMASQGRRGVWRTCPSCACEGHDDDARYCKNCGGALSAMSGLPKGTPAAAQEEE